MVVTVNSRKKLCQSHGLSRIQSIIAASKMYGDGLHVTLERQFAADQNLTLSYHENCVSCYTSKTNLVHHSKVRTNLDVQQEPTKKRFSKLSRRV